MYYSGIGIGFRVSLRFVSYWDRYLLTIFKVGMIFGGIDVICKDAPTATCTSIHDIRLIVDYLYNVAAVAGDMALHNTEKLQKYRPWYPQRGTMSTAVSDMTQEDSVKRDFTV